VHWVKQKEKWTAKLSVNGKSVRLGMFDDELVAACAYDDGVRMHGLEILLNFTNGGPPEALEVLQEWKDNKDKRGTSSSAYRGR
jgi:hypothetical protein